MLVQGKGRGVLVGRLFVGHVDKLRGARVGKCLVLVVVRVGSRLCGRRHGVNGWCEGGKGVVVVLLLLGLEHFSFRALVQNLGMDEVKVEIWKAGDGVNYPRKGHTVTVHYTAFLKNGKQWDSVSEGCGGGGLGCVG